MNYALGIDLGTTNSVAAVYRRGKIETLMLDGMHGTFPSVVNFKDDDTILVGHPAKNRIIIDPEHSVASVKRFMGDRNKKFNINGKEYTPVDISAIILKEMVEKAGEILKTKIEDVIITVPAYFNNNQKSDTLAAGKKAGLNVLQLIPEPTAAAIAYGLDKGRDQTIMVYDFGGGTFDVSILKITGNKFKVIAVDGDSHLGGDDLDNAIVDYLIQQLKNKKAIDLATENQREVRLVRQKLKEAAEKAKKELSQAHSTEILIPEVFGTTLEEVLTREKFNELIKLFLDTTIVKMRSVLNEAQMKPEDIDRVILVGGSTYNVAVRELVTREIKDPYTSEKVEEEVARGAAILAASLTLPEADFTPLEVENVTAHSLGLRVTKGKDADRFKVLLKRQTPVPAIVEEKFTTYKDRQRSVEIAVFQGENDYCSQNTFIGGFVLDGIPVRPAGVPIVSVQFEMDSSDILQVHAYCDDSSGHVDLNVNETSEETFSTQSPECIVLLIDLSYSMEGWKLKTTKEAVTEFLRIKSETRSGQDVIGCVVFASHAQTVSPLTKDFDFIGRKVQSMKTQGSTNMADGLKYAQRCLEENRNRELKSRIIMLSDGEPDSKMQVRRMVDKLVKENVRVDTVGAGKDYNKKLLQEIAGKTGGQFEAADNIDALLQAFINLAEL
ncbi:Hsp70 family protein [candidate division KSB1 bacterium]|nr:Hsp70 family protein [candidate division KSB1 bacterium]